MSLYRQLFLAVLFLVNYRVDAQNIFFEKYPDAIEIVERTYEELSLLKELPNNKGRILYSIVAPEVAMYKKFMDVFETKTAEVFYTNWGSDYANFSLGIFQIKPSFAENIEKEYSIKFPKGKYIDSLRYTDTNSVEVRTQRINRLKSPVYQQIYLICFYEILESRFNNQFKSLYEKLAFYAAAYNYGYKSPKKEIIEWQSKTSFPGRGEPSLVSYSDLSLAFLGLWVQDAKTETIEKVKDIKEDTLIQQNYTVQHDSVAKGTIINSNSKIKPNETDTKKYYYFIFIGVVIVLLIFLLRQKKML